MTPPSTPRYPKLPENLKQQLDAITPSVDGDLKYYPCQVRLQDGTRVDRVYLVSEIPYLGTWLHYPQQDRYKFEVRVQDLAAIEESPSRLPARFANELYQAGESGMGYTIFTVVFSDGSQQAYLTGNAVDFIEYPEGKGARDVVSVLPHVGRETHYRNGPDYCWCLYSE